VRLSLFVDPQEGMSYRQLADAAARAERDGYHGLYRSDHLTSTAGRHERAATEAWSTLAGLARETSRIRLGTLVTPIAFRHPAVYAKAVATVDEMSGGRVDASVGTGWYPPEHELLGLGFPALRERFAAMAEYLEVVRRLWAGDGEAFEGARYRLGSVPARPLTERRPGPWLILGGHGRRHTPRLAAAFADEFNVDWPSPALCRELFAVADEECARIGRDGATLRRSALLGAIVGADEADVERRFQAGMAFFGIEDPAGWRAQAGDGWTIGTTATLAGRLAEYADAGVEHIMLMLLPGDDLEMISLVARDVFPAVGHWDGP
jgi:alkanesulfonate monooxygenase SsuD/methylene tetrahydromethanopterin reductase-like flavin-dependent oxidoreductase (luciferase family)